MHKNFTVVSNCRRVKCWWKEICLVASWSVWILQKPFWLCQKVITSKDSVGVFLESKHSFFLGWMFAGEYVWASSFPTAFVCEASLIKNNDCDLAKVYLHCIQEIWVALNELISQTVSKQEDNFSFSLHLSEALCRFSSIFFFLVHILSIRSKYLVFDFCSQPTFVMLPICLWESSFQWDKWCSCSVPGMTTAADISGRAIGVWKAFLFCCCIMSRLSAAFNHTSGFT